MMNILIENETRSEYGISYSLTCGNKSAYVGFNFTMQSVSVCVKNASHKAYRGNGRRFSDFEAAIEGYKSPEVRSMIRFLSDAIKPELAIA